MSSACDALASGDALARTGCDVRELLAGCRLALCGLRQLLAMRAGVCAPAPCAARARDSLLALPRVAPVIALATGGSASAAASVADELEKAQPGAIDVLGGVLCTAASGGARTADALRSPPRSSPRSPRPGLSSLTCRKFCVL